MNKIIKILLYIVFLTFPIFSFSQELKKNIGAPDLIVKQTGDSIECKINKLENNYIYYVTKTVNNSIHTSDVKYYEFGYYTRNPEKRQQAKKQNQYYIRQPKDYKWIQIGANVGFAKKSEELKNTTTYPLDSYYKELKKGISLSADITYYFNQNFGAGIKYNLFTSSNEISGIEFQDTLGLTHIGTINDRIMISCVGVFFAAKHEVNKNLVNFNFGIGQMMYNDKNFNLTKTYIKKGNAFGVFFDLGYSYLFTENFSVGANISYQTGGKIKELKRDGMPINLHKDHYINLSNISLSVGLKFFIY